MTETKDAKDTKATPGTYPKTLWQATPDGGIRQVTATDEASEKALRPPGFATVREAADYAAPLEQPIPHIERTANEEQFDPIKSRAGQPIPSGVVRTPPPVQNVFVQTGIEPDTLHLTAVVPDAAAAEALKPKPPGGETQTAVVTSVAAPGQLAQPAPPEAHKKS